MENIKLVTLLLVLSLIFPVFSYGLTSFGLSGQDYDYAIDPDDLLSAGIILGNAESHNITYSGGWVYYNLLNNTDVRMRWVNSVLTGDVFQVDERGSLGRILNTWIFARPLRFRIVATNQLVYDITNSTVVTNFDTSYNWTRAVLVATGQLVFFHPYLLNNMTYSVYTLGNVTVTIGETLDTDESINFWEFVNWYSSLLLGSNSYGLPNFLIWIIRVITALQVLAGIVVLKELFGRV